METQETNLLRRVYINGDPERLPVDGTYNVVYKNGRYEEEIILDRTSQFKVLRPQFWLDYILFYLVPVPLEEIIAEMKQANPYPESVFTPIPKEELKTIVKLLRENGYSPDCLFGHWGRQVWNNCIEQIAKELGGVK